MKKIIIIGAGGYGRELLQWVKDINEYKPTWIIAGFIDDDLDSLEGIDCDYPIIGRLSDWEPKEDEEFALAIGNPKTKEKIVKIMKDKNAVFANVIHPTATLTKFSKYGEGLVMFPQSKLSVNSQVGDFVTILSSGIGHDVQIGDYTTISGLCSVLRNVRIGKRVFLASNVAVAQDIVVEDDAYLGIGSVVIKNVPAGAKVFGNPARVMPI
ncbi:GDP-perosamine N-acetyltransferase [bioreactor metagenome]|uniref:GDP-perosamine N-acetyltransferase n=1 Tax=bioreactor metagenome TaxID=1076179 RepID=A0A644YMF5_9ZZZZ